MDINRWAEVKKPKYYWNNFDVQTNFGNVPLLTSRDLGREGFDSVKYVNSNEIEWQTGFDAGGYMNQGTRTFIHMQQRVRAVGLNTSIGLFHHR